DARRRVSSAYLIPTTIPPLGIPRPGRQSRTECTEPRATRSTGALWAASGRGVLRLELLALLAQVAGLLGDRVLHDLDGRDLVARLGDGCAQRGLVERGVREHRDVGDAL